MYFAKRGGVVLHLIDAGYINSYKIFVIPLHTATASNYLNFDCTGQNRMFIFKSVTSTDLNTINVCFSCGCLSILRSSNLK